MIRSHLALLGCALFAAACGNSAPTGNNLAPAADTTGGGGVELGDTTGDPGAGPAVRTEASLANGSIVVGDTSDVTCTAYDAEDRVVGGLSFSAVVAPAEVATASGLTLTGHKPGAGTVRCATADVAEAAQAPAKFVVVAGAIAKLVAKAPATDTVVGDIAPITCSAEDASGHAVALPAGAAQLKAEAPLKITVAGGLGVVSTVAGKHPVRCTLASPALTSDPVDVRFVAGAATGVTALVDPQEITAGGTGAKATCGFVDDFGNVATAPPGATSTLDSAADLTVIDGVVTSKKAGDYALTCTSGALKKVPGKLRVLPDVPAFTKVTLTPTEVEAGKGAQAACVAYDQFGNVADPQPKDWSLKAPASCSASGGTAVSCTKTGQHAVTCETAAVTDFVPATLTVVAGPPVNFKLALDPESDNYATGQKIGLKAVSKDAFGNDVPDLAIAPIKVTPQGALVDTVNAQVSLEQDGLYTISATLKDFPKLKASRKVLSDSSGPLINVSSPKRGVTRIHTSTVTVKFSTADELSGLGSVTFNGKPVKAGDGIGLSAVMSVSQGLNLIRIVAKDKWGNASSHTQSFYSAKAYNKTQTKDGSGALIANGVEAWLGQKVLDSGYRNHKSPKDIATVVELVLKNFDTKALLSAKFPVGWSFFKFVVSITSVKFGNSSINKGYPKIKLTAKNGGLGLGATIYSMVANVYAEGQNLASPNLKIKVTATSASVSGNVSVTVYSSGTVKAKTSGVKVKLNGLKVSIENGWGFLVNWLLNLFDGTITKALENTLKEQIGAKLDGPLGNMLQAFAIDTGFNVPGFFGGLPTPLKMSSKLSSLNFYGPASGKPGGARIRMKAGLTSVKKISRTIHGALARRSCLKTSQTLASFDKVNPMDIALHHDSANQLLAAMWQSGALLLTVDPSVLGGLDLKAYGISNLKVKTDFLLPPILSDCVPGGKPELQLGDIRMDISATMGGKTLIVRAYVSAAATVSADAVKGLNGKEIALNVGKIHTLESDIDSVLLGGVSAGEGTIGFFEKLLPAVTGALVGQLQGTLASVPLPSLDLSVMTTLVPKGTTLAIDVQSVTSPPGHVQARGGVK